jgi:hypothetical protein
MLDFIKGTLQRPFKALINRTSDEFVFAVTKELEGSIDDSRAEIERLTLELTASKKNVVFHSSRANAAESRASAEKRAHEEEKRQMKEEHSSQMAKLLRLMDETSSKLDEQKREIFRAEQITSSYWNKLNGEKLERLNKFRSDIQNLRQGIDSITTQQVMAKGMTPNNSRDKFVLQLELERIRRERQRITISLEYWETELRLNSGSEEQNRQNIEYFKSVRRLYDLNYEEEILILKRNILKLERQGD